MFWFQILYKLFFIRLIGCFGLTEPNAGSDPAGSQQKNKFIKTFSKQYAILF